MNKLSWQRRAQIIGALVEGNSIRSACRMTGAAKLTVLSLPEAAGRVAQKYHDETFRNLECRRVQCDEMWSFCYAKKANVPEERQGAFGVGDVWTWVAMDVDT